MKRTNKYLSLALAIIMALSLCVTSFAANDGSITLNNAVVGETYTLYKVFDATYTGSGENLKIAYTYTGDPATDAFLNTMVNDATCPLKATLATTGKYNIAKANAEVTDEAVLTFIKNNATKYTLVETIPASSTTVVFDEIGYGYYYITTSLGSLVTVNSAAKDVTVQEKNSVPTMEKKIVNGNNLVDEITADITDVVNFKITITDGKGTDNAIVLHDTMENGLTLDATSIKINGAAITAEIGTVESSEHAFTINFADTYIAGLNENATIVVTYSATLNAGAEIFGATGESNDNEAWITYSQQTSEHDIVKVETHQFDVFKYTGTTEEKNPLPTAEFVLKNTDNQFAKATLNGTVYTFNGWTANEKEAMTFVAPATTAEFTIKGLAEGTYNLIETKAPEGYNMLTVPVEVEIEVVENAEETATVEVMQLSQDGVSVEQIEVLNQSGALLPSTGGVGTTMFYVLGSVMMIGAAILLVTKKKMANEQ